MTHNNKTLLDVQDDFPCLDQTVHGKRLAYLDSAATALKPACVIEAVTQHYATESANIHRGVHDLSEKATAAYEHTREVVRGHLNAASVNEIIFTSGTTDGINLVARSFGDAHIGAGDEILITGMEHHSNIVPWQMLRDRTGAVLRVAPITAAGELDVSAFRDALNPRTKLVAFTAVSNALGSVNPTEQLVRDAHAVGARVLVDAAQAVPVQAVDVQALGCDFLVFSGHKVFGPTGTGVLYGKQDLLESLSPVKGGGDMILSVTFEETTYNTLPYKFEAGTGNIAGVIGLGRALEYVRHVGYPAIEAHEAALVEAALDAFTQIPGIRLIGEPRERKGIISFLVDDMHPHDLGSILDHEGVAIRAGHHCAQPVMKHFGVTATARASFSIYNTPEDIHQLVAAIKKAKEIFA